MEHKVVTDYSDVGLSEGSNVKVFVRLRPPEVGGPMPASMLVRDPDAGASRKITIKVPPCRPLHSLCVSTCVCVRSCNWG